MLIDSGRNVFEDMIDLVQTKKCVIIDTTNCDECHEYRYLLNTIDLFEKSNTEIMLVKFSGKESIVQDLGDERPAMILSLSNDETSNYYTEKPVEMLTNLVEMFA